jgi:hypothetical protein
MDRHRLFVDVGLERVVGVGEGRNLKGHVACLLGVSAVSSRTLSA